MMVSLEGNELVVRIPMLKVPVKAKGTPQKPGKNYIVASSHGNVLTSISVDGRPVTVGFNAFIPPPGI